MSTLDAQHAGGGVGDADLARIRWPAGYALARLRFKGAGFLGLAIFATYLVPTSLLFIPMLQVVKTLHVQDNFWSLVLIYPTFLIPCCTWLMAGYFKTIPTELEECARIDGATLISISGVR